MVAALVGPDNHWVTAQRIEVGGSRFWESVELSEEQAEVFEKLGYEKPLKRFEAVLAETP